MIIGALAHRGYFSNAWHKEYASVAMIGRLGMCHGDAVSVKTIPRVVSVLEPDRSCFF